MNITIKYLILVVVIACGGCSLGAPYKHPEAEPYALFYLDSKNDTTSHTSVKRVDAFLSASDLCEKRENGSNVGTKIKNSPTHTTAKNKIPANQVIVLSAQYGEAGFAYTRDCIVTVKFTPKESHLYMGQFDIVGHVSKCFLDIFDVTDEEKVLVQYPERACEVDKQAIIKNGGVIQVLYR